MRGGGRNLPLSLRHKSLLSTGQHANGEHCYQLINLMSPSPQRLTVSEANNTAALLRDTPSPRTRTPPVRVIPPKGVSLCHVVPVTHF